MHAKSGSPPAAIAGRFRKTCCAATAETSWRAASVTSQLMVQWPSSTGLASSSALTSVVVSSTAGSIAVKSHATSRMGRRGTALAHPTLSLTVRVVKHASVRYLTKSGRVAKILSRVVRSRAGRCLTADMNARRPATRASALHAGRRWRLHADAAAPLRLPYAIKATLSRPNACAYAKPASTAEDTSAASGAALVRRRLWNDRRGLVGTVERPSLKRSTSVRSPVVDRSTAATAIIAARSYATMALAELALRPSSMS